MERFELSNLRFPKAARYQAALHPADLLIMAVWLARRPALAFPAGRAGAADRVTHHHKHDRDQAVETDELAAPGARAAQIVVSGDHGGGRETADPHRIHRGGAHRER